MDGSRQLSRYVAEIAYLMERALRLTACDDAARKALDRVYGDDLPPLGALRMAFDRMAHKLEPR